MFHFSGLASDMRHMFYMCLSIGNCDFSPPSLWWLAVILTLKTIANDSFMPLGALRFAKTV